MGAAVPAEAQRRRGKLVAWGAEAIAVVIAVAGAAHYIHRTPPAERQTVRFTVGPPEKGSFHPAPMFLTISPDGSKLAFVAIDASGKQQLWVRALDSPALQPLFRTNNASQPFWSADGRFIAFYAEGKLKKIAASGGPAVTLADSQEEGAAGTWSAEGVILFSSGTGSGIYRVSAAGGAAAPVTMLDASRQESAHGWPYFLPDGKHFLYFASSAKWENNAIFVGSLDSKERKLLLNATSNAIYVTPGYLLFSHQGTLMAQGFDVERLQLKGEAGPSQLDLQRRRR